MPSTATPTPSGDPKQAAYDALNALLATATSAASNPLNTPAAQNTAYDLRTAIVAQLQALNLAVFTGNTVALQAGAAAMTPATTQLKALQTRIAALGNTIKEGTSILTGIGQAITDLGALGLI
jgi:hypothetical protein